MSVVTSRPASPGAFSQQQVHNCTVVSIRIVPDTDQKSCPWSVADTIYTGLTTCEECWFALCGFPANWSNPEKTEKKEKKRKVNPIMSFAFVFVL